MQKENIKERLDHISKEVVQLKKILIYKGVIDKDKTEATWEDLIDTSKQISKRWKGRSAVEEIREQREKMK